MTDSRRSDETNGVTIEVLPLALFALVILELTALVGQHLERGAASFFEAPTSPFSRLVGLPVRSLGLPGAYVLMAALLTLVVVWWVKKGVDHAERRAIGLPLLLLSLAGLSSLMEGQGVVWGGRFGESLRVFFLMILPHGLAVVLALALFAFALILARDWFFFDRLKEWVQRSTGEAFALGVPGGGGVPVAPEPKTKPSSTSARLSEPTGLDLRPYEDEVRPVTPVDRIDAPKESDTVEEKVVDLTDDMARDDVKVEESITAEVPIELQEFAAGLDAEDRELEELANALDLPETTDEPFEAVAEEPDSVSDRASVSEPAPVYGSAFGPPTWAHDEDASVEEIHPDDTEAPERAADSVEVAEIDDEEEEFEEDADLEEYALEEYDEEEFEDTADEAEDVDPSEELAADETVEDFVEDEELEETLIEDEGLEETNEDDVGDDEVFELAAEPEFVDDIDAEEPEEAEASWDELEDDGETSIEEADSASQALNPPLAVQSHLFEPEDEMEVGGPPADEEVLAEASEATGEDSSPVPSRPEELDWAPWDETPQWSSVPPTRFETRGAPASGPGAIPVYDQAVELCLERDACSVSLLQRELGLDFRTSASLIERMEAEGLVGPYRGTGHREILGSLEEWRRRPAP